jgi:hypothetical protein
MVLVIVSPFQEEAVLSVIAPPVPPKATDEPGLDPLDALIEEARRRARRRRRYGACALLLALAAGAGAFGFGRSGDGGGSGRLAAKPAPPSGGGIQPVRVPIRAANGALTILGGEGISTIAPPGLLRTLVRCGDEGAACSAHPFSVDWAPDGRRLAYSVAIGPGAAPERWKVVGLHIRDTVTGVDRRLQTPCFPTGLDWAPDGSQLAYACDGRIYLVNSDLTGRTLLRTGVPGVQAAPSWSPDGQHIVFASRGRDRSADAGRLPGSQSALYITPARSFTPTSTQLVTSAMAPSWSPDGTKIAYWSACGGIKLVTPDGVDVTPPVRRTSACALGIRGAPAWSPDGRKIAMGNGRWPGGCGYVRTAPVRLSGVCVLPGTYVMNADGGDLHLVMKFEGGWNFAGGGRPTWWPVPIP